MALLLGSHRDFDVADQNLRSCRTCGEWLVRYVPYCTVCNTPVGPVAFPEAGGTPGEKAEGAVRIAHMSDLHLGRPRATPKPFDTFRIWMDALAEVGVDIVAISGDVVQRPGDVKSLRAARGILEESGLPFVVVPGNHDIDRPGKPGSFEDIFGTFPRTETHHGLTFILIDSNAGLPPDERRRHERLFARIVCFVEGRVGEEQLRELDDMLEVAPKGPRVLLLHHHLVSQPQWVVRMGLMAPLQDAHVVRRWAMSQGVILALHGHHHIMRRAGVQSGGLVVLNGGSSTLEGPPYRARLVDVHRGGKRRVVPVELRL